MQAKKK